jgi:hypothetical protein
MKAAFSKNTPLISPFSKNRRRLTVYYSILLPRSNFRPKCSKIKENWILIVSKMSSPKFPKI